MVGHRRSNRTCKICGESVYRLYDHMKKRHNLSKLEYAREHNQQELMVCPICQKEYVREFKYRDSKTSCSKECSKKIGVIQRKKTCLEKYGVVSHTKTKEYKEYMKKNKIGFYDIENTKRAKKTTMEKYGVENVSQLEFVKDRKKETCRENFGVDWPTQSQIVLEKREETCLEKYGVKSPMQNKEVIAKVRKTSMEKYGTNWMSQSSFVKEKVKNTNNRRYGVKNVFQSEQVKKKTKETMLERYGVESPINIPGNFEKMFARRWFTSKVENVLYDFLLDEFGKENVKRQAPLRINGKLQRIDFYIKVLDLYLQLDGVFWHGFIPITKNNKFRESIINNMEKDKQLNLFASQGNISLVRIKDVDFFNYKTKEIDREPRFYLVYLN